MFTRCPPFACKSLSCHRDRAQPWKQYFEKELAEKETASEEIVQKKPWLNWKPEPEDPSYKPFLSWNPNIDNGEVNPMKRVWKTQIMGGCSR